MTYANTPLWLVSILFLAGLIVAREAGKYLRDRRGPQAKDDSDDTFAMTSILGLLALLIGFTFSIALSRYDARRELVVKEANAIGTTWLRVQLLDEASRPRVEDILRRYVDARVAFGAARGADDEVARYAQTAKLQTELWNAMVAATAPFKDTPRASLVLSTTNDSIDLAAERFATRQAHIPNRILRMLAVFSLLAAGMVGYQRGTQRTATTLLFVLLTLAVTLVLDLDRPSTGITNVPQSPMLELRESMRP